MKLGDKVRIIGRYEKNWRIHEIYPNGQITCLRKSFAGELKWNGYALPWGETKEGEDQFVTVIDKSHLVLLTK